MWLKELKIALIQKDIQKLNELISKSPKLKEQNEIDEAICLINEAKELVISLKNDTEISMIKMKKSIEFLQATEEVFLTNKLDVTS